MPIPTLTGLPPNPSFQDLVDRVNKIVRETNNMLLNLDSLNVVSLTADHIDAGTIDANIVTIRSDLTAGAYVQIDGNGLVINDGSRNTFRADITGHVTMTGATIVNTLVDGAYTNISDGGITINDGTADTFRADVTGKVTMTGALIRSKYGYPAIVMNPDGDLVGAYVNANNSVSIVANDLGSPALNFTYGGSVVGQLNTRLGLLSIEGRSDVEIFADAGDIYLNAANRIITNATDWSKYRTSTDVSLQDALNGKANYGSSTSSASGGGHNHGIPNGTVLMVDGGGTVTWSVYGGFTHSHTQN